MNTKNITIILGILLIVFGVGTFAYRGITYTTREQVLKIGDVQVTADTDKTIYVHPWMSALALVAGVVLVVAGRRS